MIDARTRRLGAAAACLGAAVLLAAGVWWWVVFRQIVLNAYMSVGRALPCMVNESVVCRLAQALCTSDHFLGIHRYWVEISWVGAGLVGTGTLLRLLPRHTARTPLLAEGK